MKLVMDVAYGSDGAQVGAVAFDDWAAPEASATYRARVAHVEKAPPGQPWLRELPCLMQLLREHALAPEAVLIDGFVHLDAQDTPGLGQHLHHALGGLTAVIGISRTPLVGAPAQFEVLRDEEAAPLYVTSVGIDLGAAKARVRLMHGKRRLPTLLKLATRLSKATD